MRGPAGSAAGTSTARGVAHPWRCLVSLAVAAAAFGGLVPSALAMPTRAAVAQPPAVALEGVVSTVGLPQTPAVSLLQVRNAGSVPIRWSVATEVVGSGAAAVAVVVWIPAGGSCANGPAPGLGRRWSKAALPAGQTIPLIGTVSSEGTGPGHAEPRVRVAALAA